MPVGIEEEIVRAICTDKFDEGMVSPSLFRGNDTSVSRLAVLSREDHWEIFRRTVQRPPERMLERIGQITVGHLEAIGRSYQVPIVLTVEPDPLEENPAHAVIPQKISRGLSTQIVRALTLHKDLRG